MAKFWVHFVLAFFLCFPYAEGGRKFLLGRRRGGFIPPPPPEALLRDTSRIQTKFFTQKLDHFDKLNNATWKQRYMISDDFHKKDGPIFVMIGGEGTISLHWQTYGQMYLNAKQYGAMILQLEHRFYGESHPVESTSRSNLQYLSSRQALADLDYFIQSVKDMHDIPNAKVVVFGGSYSGNLAVWYRELYPHSTVGAVASSAPVLAKEDFVEYMETVGNALKYFDPNCYTAVKQAFTKIQALVAAKDDEQLDTLFGLCDPPKLNYSSPYEIDLFYDSLIENWMGATQYNQPGNSSKLAAYCRLMTNEALGDPVHRFSKWFKTDVGSCAEHDYEKMVQELRNESWTAEMVQEGARQWTWQTCTEFAYYQSTDSENQPFGRTIDLDYLEETFCDAVFGIPETRIASAVLKTNKRYRGRNPKVTNVFFMNGSIDPWHTLSIFEHDLNPTSPSRYIEGTSHCYDMYENIPGDPTAMIKARQERASALAVWLRE